jgi:hypothetical protein
MGLHRQYTIRCDGCGELAMAEPEPSPRQARNAACLIFGWARVQTHFWRDHGYDRRQDFCPACLERWESQAERTEVAR